LQKKSCELELCSCKANLELCSFSASKEKSSEIDPYQYVSLLISNLSVLISALLQHICRGDTENAEDSSNDSTEEVTEKKTPLKKGFTIKGGRDTAEQKKGKQKKEGIVDHIDHLSPVRQYSPDWDSFSEASPDGDVQDEQERTETSEKEDEEKPQKQEL
jgi:hypothetical protein